MEPEEVYEAVARALRRLDEAQRETERELAELKAGYQGLVDLLIKRGTLAEGHRRHLGQVARAAQDGRRTIRLRTYVDKYGVECDDPVDCAALMHLCKARCCSLTIELSSQDLEEGKLRWNLDEPYLLRKDGDGQCTHLDRSSGSCTVYEHRPATCRSYSCKHDRRIWLDFDKRIPAPIE